MSKIKVNSIEAATGSTITIPSGQTLDISSTTLTLPSTVVTTTGSQTLTNKVIGVSQLTGTLGVSNGGTGLTSLGTASQVLRVNSGATALEFATPDVASSDYVLLATTTASNSASVSFDGYFSSTYDTYIVYAYGLYAASGGTAFQMRFRRSNADINASNYANMATNHQNAGYDGQIGTARSSFDLTAASAASFSSTSTDNNSYRIEIFNPLSATTHKTMIFHGFLKRNDGNLFTTSGSGQLSDNANALSGVSFFMSSGNIYGKFKLYGIK